MWNIVCSKTICVREIGPAFNLQRVKLVLSKVSNYYYYIMERKIIQWLVSFFFFLFQTHFANLQFTSNDNLQIVHVQVVTCPLRFWTLKCYIFELIGWSVPVTSKSVRQGSTWPWPKFSASKNVSPRIYQRQQTENAENFSAKEVTSMRLICSRRVTNLVEKVKNQSILMPH